MSEMSDLFEMMLHIADENACELRYREKQQRRSRSLKHDDDAERAFHLLNRRVQEHRLYLGDHDLAIDDDDADYLVATVKVVEERPGMTVMEIMMCLQRNGLLSREFIAAARERTKRCLAQLIQIGVIQTDGSGHFKSNRRRM